MVPSSVIPGAGLVWVEAVMTVMDGRGVDRLVARCDRIKNLGESYERGLVIFNDMTETFDRLVQFDLGAPLYPAGRPFPVDVDGEKYYYFPSWYPSPLTRVKADLKHITDANSYEGFTCLVAGSRYDKDAPRIDRGRGGRLSYAWKAGTPPLDYKQQKELIASGRMNPGEGLLHLTDVDTGAEIEGHSGSVYWNEFRRRWIMIAQKNVGEVWYAEGDTPVGPWVYAKKIVSHDRYTFYWPGHFPFFDQEGGRLIYFGGTYTDMFSGSPEKTPRYNYNQIMYRLRLDDPRLLLPVPIYQVRTAEGRVRYVTREGVEAQNLWDRIEAIPFLALPPHRAREAFLPFFDDDQDGTCHDEARQQSAGIRPRPVFYALPAEPDTSDLTHTGAAKGARVNFIWEQQRSPAVVPLYEYRRGARGTRSYSADPDLKDATLRRSTRPICRVWRNPMSLLVLDRKAKPVPIAVAPSAGFPRR